MLANAATQVPPRVAYALTELGVSLERALPPLGDRGERHLAHIVAARRAG